LSLSAKKIYFASDFHLGVPDYQKSLDREKRIIRWLDEISCDASEIYLMGDVFDFWFEYRTVVPRGFVRLLGKLAQLSDQGVIIHFFTGNHDMWAFDYLQKEIGVRMYRNPIIREIHGKKFYLGHGDGLGPGDTGYKILKRFFASKACQWLFARMHPNASIALGKFWSGKSRKVNSLDDEKFLGEDKEWLAIHCRQVLQKEHIDYFIFGHRHLIIDMQVGENSRYVNLGEWIFKPAYAVFDGSRLEVIAFQ